MSIVSPKGFVCAYTDAGFKHKNRNDMAIIISKEPAICAGTFTKNIVKAAPVLWDKAIVEKKGIVRGVVINSGVANACTGQAGEEACKLSAKYMSDTFGFGGADQVLVASTGVIGTQLPVEKIYNGIDKMKDNLSDNDDTAHLAATAIMTTDTKPKEVSKTVMIGDTKVSIGGMAKGSGMIHPNMGTMLSFITTDVNISPELLQEALVETVGDTYNMISVDGDTSTNDSCLILANAMAKNEKIIQKNKAYCDFVDALFEVNLTLAKMMAADGEGATALFETKIINAASKQEAKVLAKSVITSSLTKAAIFGHDANWGRILCALGYSGEEFDPYKVDIIVESNNGKIQLVNNGIACDYSEEEATKVLSSEEVCVICDMKQGSESASAYGCDLTYDYVKINADYRS